MFRLLESDGDTGLAGEPGGVPRGCGSGPSSLGSGGGAPLLALLGGLLDLLDLLGGFLDLQEWG